MANIEYAVFLIDNWSSSKGGIQTVNRELCKSMAKLFEVNESPHGVICLANTIDEGDEADAAENGVKLLKAQDAPWQNIDDIKDKRILQAMWHPDLDDLEIAHVIGHSKFTGLAAYNLKKHILNKTAFVYFVHMDPEHDELLKSLSKMDDEDSQDLDEKAAEKQEKEIQRRIEFERKMIKEADLVVAIGPKLKKRVGAILGNKCKEKCEELLCGLSEREIRDKQPEEAKFLVMGRTDNIYLKGQDIFAKAAGLVARKWNDEKLKKPMPKFIVFGAGKGTVKKLRSTLQSKADEVSDGNKAAINVKPFTAIDEMKDEEYHEATAVVMPSRSEGFGLVGVEAASHGVPIVVSAGSGLGMHLRDKLESISKEKSQRYNPANHIIDTDREDAADALADVLFNIASDDSIGRVLGKRTYDVLQECSWRIAAQSFSRLLGFLPQEVEFDFIEHSNLPAPLLDFMKHELDLNHRPTISLKMTDKSMKIVKEGLEHPLKEILGIYNKLKARKRLNNLSSADKKAIQSNLYEISTHILVNPRATLENISQDGFDAFFELRVAHLIESGDPYEFDIFLFEIIAMLEWGFAKESNISAIKAAVPGVESLVWALQRLDWKMRQKAIRFLRALAVRDVKWDEDRITVKTAMEQLFQSGMYVEINDFLKTHQGLPKEDELRKELLNVKSSVMAVLSRKGGTGKSLFSVMTILHHLKKNPSSSACVIDMDFAGPTWQYLLFPEEDKPSRFLNELLDEEGLKRGSFSFNARSLARNLANLLHSKTIRNPKGNISLLTLRDLPRTNRHLQKAILENPQNYAKFLVCIIKKLSKMGYSMVVIDNSPGFSLIPLLSHRISSHVKQGGSIVVSTPYIPDMRGVLIDLADERILNRGKAPVWVINKVLGKSKEFLSKKQTIYDLASATKAYGSLIPNRPVVSKMQKKVSAPFAVLELDENFLSFVTVKDAEEVKEPNREINELMELIIRSKLMKQFSRRVMKRVENQFGN